jgi:beta-mannosidase
MRTDISLDGGWRYCWSHHMGACDEPPEQFDVPWRDAAVPGCAQLDLMRDGILPDLYVGKNLDHAQWTEDKDWWYTREFETPADWGTCSGSPRPEGEGDRNVSPELDRAILVFHGLDTFATVWLNGTRLGDTDNMHRRYEFDVTDTLSESGPNTLAVRLASTRYSISIDPNHKPMIWSPERLFCRKAQMSFGWDIAPRLMTVGIWRPVELVLVEGGRIANASAALTDLKSGTVKVQVEVEWHGPTDAPARIEGRIHDAEWETRASLRPGRNVVECEVSVPDAPLWWPIGYGEPQLCDLSVTLESAGNAIDTVELKTGLRTIELIEEPQPSGATSFEFRVNGTDVFVTGLNWTPLDAIFARVTPQKITDTLEQLAGIGCNMLRVWGGGIYEGQHFYSECDRLGIMIWQDFMMACGWYPQTDAMADAFDAEARQIVRDLRHHPCIALWVGDNECDVFEPDLAPQNRLTREVLAGACRELHPDIPYLPSSPYSPNDPDPQAETEGDMHWYAHGEDYRESCMWSFKPRFMSEFGHLSLPSLALIEQYFPSGTEWPLTTEMWKYHGTDTIQTGRFRWTDCVLKSLAVCGRPQPKDIEEAVAESQELQSEAMIALIERYSDDLEFRGFLIWNVADCWPQMSDSVIDYLGHPKLIFARLAPLFTRLRHDRTSGSKV